MFDCPDRETEGEGRDARRDIRAAALHHISPTERERERVREGVRQGISGRKKHKRLTKIVDMSRDSCNAKDKMRHS